MIDPRIQRCRDEQEIAKQNLMADPQCHGAWLGISDWLHEELLILGEEEIERPYPEVPVQAERSL